MDLQLFHRRFNQSTGLKLCLDEQIWYQSWPKTNTLHAWIPDTIDARYIFSVKIVKKVMNKNELSDFRWQQSFTSVKNIGNTINGRIWYWYHATLRWFMALSTFIWIDSPPSYLTALADTARRRTVVQNS